MKILFIEENLSDVEQIWQQIKDDGIQFVSKLVETESDYIDAIDTFIPDIIVSGYSLSKINGMKALTLRNRESAPDSFYPCYCINK